jgi:hypothetical protein
MPSNSTSGQETSENSGTPSSEALFSAKPTVLGRNLFQRTCCRVIQAPGLETKFLWRKSKKSISDGCWLPRNPSKRLRMSLALIRPPSGAAERITVFDLSIFKASFFSFLKIARRIPNNRQNTASYLLDLQARPLLFRMTERMETGICWGFDRNYPSVSADCC